MKIKNLVLILALCFVACFSTKAYAEERGTCGDNLAWVLNDEGTLTISGTGKMTDYEYEVPAPWGENFNKVIIEDGVESIGDFAFYCADITSAEIADSVTSIGNNAFAICTTLQKIVIPERVVSIGNSVFYNCEELKSVSLPDSLTSIGYRAFCECLSLTSIKIPKNVTEIGDVSNDVFDSSKVLTSIDVSEDNNTFSSVNGALFDKNKKTLIRCPEGKSGTYTVPAGVTTIAMGAFSNCGLTEINLPEGVKEVKQFAFEGTKISDLVFPSGVTEIQDDVVSNCMNLETIEIPESIDSISLMAFEECVNLREIRFRGSEAQWKEVDYFGEIIPSGVTIRYNWKKRFPQTITAANKTITLGTKPFNLGAKVSGQGEELGKVTYASSVKSVATVSATGLITPKGYGKTNITIKAAQTDSSYEATKKVTITILPRKMILGTVKSPAKKTVLIKWTKDGTVTGYQVQLCLKSNFKIGTLARVFKASVVKTKIKNMKKKTWYVRIRAYKTVGKTNYYGAWSAVKKVKVK